ITAGDRCRARCRGAGHGSPERAGSRAAVSAVGGRDERDDGGLPAPSRGALHLPLGSSRLPPPPPDRTGGADPRRGAHRAVQRDGSARALATATSSRGGRSPELAPAVTNPTAGSAALLRRWFATASNAERSHF